MRTVFRFASQPCVSAALPARTAGRGGLPGSNGESLTPNSDSIPTQAMGRHVFDANCARCHEPYSSKGLHGPSLHNLYKKQYLPSSGMPATDERITEVIVRGRAKMPAFGNSLSDSQIDALLAYLKTL